MLESDFIERAASWIWENRNWLFSGGGLSIFALLIWIFRKAFFRRDPPPAEIVVPNQGPIGESTYAIAQSLVEQAEKRVAAEHREQVYAKQLAETNARIAELESELEALAQPTDDRAADERRERATAPIRKSKTEEAEVIFTTLPKPSPK